MRSRCQKGLLLFFLILPSAVFSEYHFQSTTVEDVITLNAPKKAAKHSFAVGGGVNFMYVDSFLDDSVGGEAFYRYTYQETISLEPTVAFNNFSVEAKGFDGDVFGIPILCNVLLHSPWWNKMRFYVLGGMGFQFNDGDLEVDVAESGVDGKLVVPPTLAGFESANNELIEAEARVTFLSSSTSTTTGATTTTSTAAATAGDTIKKEAALAAAESDVDLAEAKLAEVLKTKEIDLKSVAIPAGTKVDVDVDNGFVYTLGAGVDIEIAKNLFLNVEARYQFAEFDVNGSLDLPGFGVVKVDDQKEVEAFLLRVGVLIPL